MFNKLKYAVGGVLAISLMVTSSATAQAASMDSVFSDTESADANIGLYSQYVWRGKKQVGGLSMQGDVGLAHDSGVSANIWFATLGASDSTEFDFTLDYSADLGFMGYSAGVILYRYHNSGGANATEIYAGASHEFGSATAYYDLDSKNIWIDISSGIELEEVAVEGTLSFAGPKKKVDGKSEFVNLAVGFSKEFEADDVLISPSFTYNYHMGEYSNKASALYSPDALVFSLNLTY